ncbi:baculoviral IAP repeat-containing protein 7/8 [Mytilus galloprovincialis]|uniref:Baculoviral IAP repeat-containing protein 7/8 n=1 Tax=Mytilus galloprovincialis TaxID=29158 RepID=A0A8B6D239_MYTGA|nr:baculoviral IAP repeat-containing protein 7/8 [Mytilus galloprovincialis]
MSDIEIDSLPPGSQLNDFSGSYHSNQRSYPQRSIFPDGLSRDNFAFSGDESRQVSHPSDSSRLSERTTFTGTNGSAHDIYQNSINVTANSSPGYNLSFRQTSSNNDTNSGYNFSHRHNVGANDCGYNFSHRNNTSDNESDGYNFSYRPNARDTDNSGYNFSHRNENDRTNSQNNQSILHSNNSSNGHNIFQNSETSVPEISNLSMNESDSSFVFNRPQSHVNTRHNQQHAQIKLENSKYANYRNEAQRIQSYAYSTAPVRSPQTMSDAGFFAISNQDFVRCFHCGIGLRNWEDDDDPYVEHCRWSPNCQYMKLKKGQAFIDAVQEAVRKVQLEEALGQSDTRDGAQADGTVTYSDIAEDGENIESYPASVLQKNPLLSSAAQSVIEMGYLPRIVKRAVDNIIKEHGLSGLTGQRIANLVMDMEAKGEKVMIPTQQVSEPNMDKSKINEEAKRKLEEQNREYKEKISCVICCENERSITFLPCGHLVCCAQCAPACSSCAVCRKEIKGTVKVSLR